MTTNTPAHETDAENAAAAPASVPGAVDPALDPSLDPAVGGSSLATAQPGTPVELGTVFLPRSGTGVGSFQFLVHADALDVQIDTPVAADTPEGVVIGVITDMVTVGKLSDPLDAATDAGMMFGAPVATTAGSAKVATVQTYHARSLRPITGGSVRSATPAEMELATGSERIEVPVPAGVVELVDGSFAKINLDAHTLLGPESAHMTIGGLSGQAAKTSYAGVLLRSAMHACEQAGESIAAIVFNVKGEDLVNLHLPPAAGYELEDVDHQIYAALGIPSTPFPDVEVYAPALPGGEGTRSSREDALVLEWDLGTVWRYLKYFSPGLYSNDNMMAFLGDVEAEKINNGNPNNRLNTFNKLEAWIDTELAEAEAANRSTIWRDHHVATVRRARKIIGSLPGRCGGLLTKGTTKPDRDVPVEMMTDGRVVVVDIAGLEPIVQSAVIARTCERLLSAAEKDELGVEHVVVFADELNMFAPASGGELDAVRRILTKISATGRYAGVSLWGAAQFVSQVTPQVSGNAATRAAGILPDSEVEAGVFGRVLAGQRERLVTLPKGYMALKAHNLRGMLTVRFPRPAWQTGKPKGIAAPKRRKDATSVLGLGEKSLAALSEGLDRATVEQIVADSDGDVVEAVRRIEKVREPDMSRVSVEKTSTFAGDEDPWAIT